MTNPALKHCCVAIDMLQLDKTRMLHRVAYAFIAPLLYTSHTSNPPPPTHTHLNNSSNQPLTTALVRSTSNWIPAPPPTFTPIVSRFLLNTVPTSPTFSPASIYERTHVHVRVFSVCVCACTFAHANVCTQITDTDIVTWTQTWIQPQT